MTDHAEQTGADRAKRIAEQILVPAVAAVASAAAGYLGRRAPKLVEERLWPRLEAAVRPRLQSAGSSAGDLATDLADRAKDVVEPTASKATRQASPAERERERAARASRRDERRRATSS